MSRSAIATALLRHFEAHRRHLPWRETDDPYAIWVSEVMLQQTRVDVVVPYYRRWLDRFPTVGALAEADLDAVLHAWQGLGYYSRARNLHRAARVVREKHGGAVPADPASLRELPGVGEYTTGAVASIAFGVPMPAVDGNVRRVLSRLYDLADPGQAELRRLAMSLVPEDRPGDFNQALMELGATICTPRSPACGRCPVSRWCEARERGVQEHRPRPKRQPPVPEEEVRTLVIVGPCGRVLLARRPETGLLGGMWEFPSAERARELVIELVEAERVELAPVRHVFSHRAVTYRPALVRLQRSVDVPETAVWVAMDGRSGYAMPVAQQRIAALAEVELGGSNGAPDRAAP